MSFFRGRTTTTRANKISEFTVNTADYGAIVPEIIGTVRTAGNVIYYDDFTAHEHRETHEAGKGGKSKQVSITYTYTVAVILGLCEGPISGIGKVWIGKNVHNYPADDIQLTLFDGKENQQPWAYTQGKHPEKALPYSGLAYMAGVIDLGDSGSMPSYNFEVKGRLLETGDGIDVNPADYIRYVLDKIGKKDMKIIGLDNYRKYCKEADLLISSPPDEDAKAAREVVNEIAKLTNAYVFWSNDKLKIVPLADRPVGSWAPDKTGITDLTSDDFLPQSGGALVTYKRKDSSAIYNQFPVEFINRANGYEKESVSYEFTEDIKNYGVRAASVTNAHYIYTKERAVKIAEQLARNNKYERTQYTFKLDWSLCRLEVGDLVRLTDENSGIFEQVAVINGITEGTDGCLTVTAISRAPGDYPAAKYNVHANDRPYIDYNKAAPDTVPVIFQPPADLTVDGLELWIAAKGKENNWGGCGVYVSDDNEHYIHAGDINNSSRLGEVKSYSEDKIKVTCNGQLLSGKPEDAERGNTMCWIAGECLSYTTATLQNDGTYLLEGLVRGQYNTVKAKHTTGESFVRLDHYLLKLPFAKNDIGKKIYLKFVSRNIFGAGEQDLSAVKAYEYRLQNYFIPPVTGLTARSRYRQQVDKKSIYDVIVEWEKPDLQTYLQGDVWYKTKSATSDTFTRDWQYAGSGETQATIPQCVAGSKLLIAVCTKDTFGEVTAPDTSPQTQILVALKNEIPTTPEGFSLTFGSACTARWKEVTNADVAYYEIRIDKNPGEDTPGLLTKTNSTNCVLTLTERTGKLYLYAKSAVGKYSDSAELTYNKPKPSKPKPPKLTATLGGFSVQAEPIPTGCGGMTVYINNDTAMKTENDAMPYLCEAGIYDVVVAFYDIFGEGEKSEPSRVVVEPKIPSEWIDREKLGLTRLENEVGKIDERIAGGVEAVYESKIKGDVETRITQLNDVITQNVNNKIDGVNSRITQLDNTINLKVAKQLDGKADKANLISQINICPEAITIDGKFVHVTGNTLFDNNVIVNRMLSAKAITADKMDVSSLSAISANMGTLTAGKIKGVRYESRTGNAWIEDDEIHGMKISADSFYSTGYKIKNLDVVHIKAVPFLEIKPPQGVSLSDCIAIRILRGELLVENEKESLKDLAYKYFDKLGINYWDSNTNKFTPEALAIYNRILSNYDQTSGITSYSMNYREEKSKAVGVTAKNIPYAYYYRKITETTHHHGDERIHYNYYKAFYIVEIDLLIIRR